MPASGASSVLGSMVQWLQMTFIFGSFDPKWKQEWLVNTDTEAALFRDLNCVPV